MLTPSLRWLLAAGLSAASPLTHALDANGTAFGTHVDLQAQLLLVQANANVGPRPEVSGSGTTAYGPLTEQELGVQANLLGAQILNTGVLRATTVYDPLLPTASSQGGVDDAAVNLQLTPLVNLIGITADSVDANAAITGVCGALVAEGSTELTNAQVTALGGGLLNLPLNPAPNTVVSLVGLTNVVGLHLILNEQTQSGDARNRSISVNALHLTLDVNVLGILNSNLLRIQGDVILGQATAHRGCAPGDGPNLNATKTATPLPATVGEPLTFTLTTTNPGNQPAVGARVEDTLHPSFTFVSAQANSGGACNRTGQTVACTWSSVPAGASRVATVSVLPTLAGTFDNTMVASFPGPDVDPTNDDDTIPVLVLPAPPLPTVANFSVVKTASAARGTVGQPLSFTLEVSNAGPDASGAAVTDVLPSGASLQSAAATAGGVCTGNPSVTCSWASIPSGGSASATLTVLPTAAGILVNTAVVAPTPGTTDPTPGNNQSTISVPIDPAALPQADGQLSQSAAPQPVPAGELLTFTLTATNAGPATATLSLSDTLDTSFSLVSAQAGQGGSCTGTNPVQCSWNGVASGGVRTATVTVQPSMAGTFSNMAVLTVAGAEDPNLANNTSSASVAVSPALPPDRVADLSVTQGFTGPQVSLGGLTTVILTVSNAGPDAAAVRLTETLGTALTLSSTQATQGGTCTATAPVVCTWPSVPAGGSAQASLRVETVRPGTASVFAVVATDGGETDPQPANNSQGTSVTVFAPVSGGVSDLSVTKEAFPDQPTLNSPVAFLITVTNQGPDAAAGPVGITDVVDDRLDLISASADNGGDCAIVANSVRCTWEGIANGQMVSATVMAMATEEGTFLNAVTTDQPNTDPDPEDNTPEVQIVVGDGEARCMATDRLTQSPLSAAATGFLSYGGAQTWFNDNMGTNGASQAEGRLLVGTPLATTALFPPDATLLVTSRSGTRAVVRSNRDLAAMGHPMLNNGPGWFLANTANGTAVRLPDLSGELAPGQERVALNADGTLVAHLTHQDDQVSLRLYRPADATTQTLGTWAGSPDDLADLTLAGPGNALAFSTTLDLLGTSEPVQRRTFALDASTRVLTAVASTGTQSVRPHGFDGSGRRLVVVADGGIRVFDRTLNTTAVIQTDLQGVRSPLLTHNGTQMYFLANTGGTPDSTELWLAAADGTGQMVRQTGFRLNGGSADRLLDQEGAGQTFLMASDRDLLNEGLSGRPLGSQIYIVDCASVRSGMWYNPARSGHGFEIHPYPGGLVFVWSTYLPDGRPQWLLAAGSRTGRSFTGDLLKVTRHTMDTGRDVAAVGTISVVFRDAYNALAQWTLDGSTRFEPITFLQFATTPPVIDRTGEWYNPLESGWGLGVSHQDVLRFTTLYTFDTFGQPIWTTALFAGEQTVEPTTTNLGPGLCPVGCPETAPRPSFHAAGTVQLVTPDMGGLSFGAQLEQTAPVPLLWVRPLQALTGLAGISP